MIKVIERMIGVDQLTEEQIAKFKEAFSLFNNYYEEEILEAFRVFDKDGNGFI